MRRDCAPSRRASPRRVHPVARRGVVQPPSGRRPSAAGRPASAAVSPAEPGQAGDPTCRADSSRTRSPNTRREPGRGAPDEVARRHVVDRPADHRPGLAGDELAGRAVPRVERRLVVGVEPAGRQPAQVEGGAAVPPDVAHPRQQVDEQGGLPGPHRRGVAEAGADQGHAPGRWRRWRAATRVPRSVVSRAPPPRWAWNSSPVSGLSTAPATASHSPGRGGVAGDDRDGHGVRRGCRRGS